MAFCELLAVNNYWTQVVIINGTHEPAEVLAVFGCVTELGRMIE